MPKQVLELLKRIRQSVTMRALGGLALLAVTFAYAEAVVAVGTSPKTIDELRAYVERPRGSIAEDELELMAFAAALQVPGNFNISRVPQPDISLVQQIERDVRSDLGATVNDALDVPHTAWAKALRSRLTDADIDQLLTFFHSDLGKQYLEFQSRLDALIPSVEQNLWDGWHLETALADSGGPPSRELKDARRTLFNMTWTVLIGKYFAESPSFTGSPLIVQYVSPDSAEWIITSRGLKLDQIQADFANRLAGFHEFQSSVLMSKVFEAAKDATLDSSRSLNFAKIVASIDQSIKTRMPEWRADYASKH